MTVKQPNPIGSHQEQHPNGERYEVSVFGCPHAASEDGIFVWTNTPGTTFVALNHTQTMCLCSLCYQAILGHAYLELEGTLRELKAHLRRGS